MAVEVVRRHVDLVDVRHRGDLQRLVQPVPDHVDDRHIGRVIVEERLELAPAVQRLARRDRAGRAALDLGQRRRVVRVDLQPGQVERRDRLGDALEALGLEVEVDVEMDAHLRADRGTDGRELIAQPAQQPVVPVQFRPARRAAEAWHVGGGLAVLDRDDVGLQRAEARPLHLLGMARQVVVAVQRRHAHQRRAAHAVGAEMRPVDRDAVADRSAEQRIDRHAIGLAGHVEQRVLDRGDRLLVDAAARLARDARAGAG